MSHIYWIHLAEHTDIFKEGYVGFTSKSIARRFASHKSNARTFRNQTLGIERAIRKYGDRLKIDILCIGTKDYCLDLEKKLRPNPGIGWNISVGGGPCLLGKKATEKARENMRRAKVGFVFSAAHRKAISEAKKGIATCPTMWRRPKAKKIMWLNAINIFELLRHHGRLPYRGRPKGMTLSDVHRLNKHFKQGWNPLEDHEYLQWRESHA